MDIANTYQKHEIPRQHILKWQKTVDLAAEIYEVPAALIRRAWADKIEVLVTSNCKGNPYKPGAMTDLGSGLLCEPVMAQKTIMTIPDALKKQVWNNSPDIKAGMTSYMGIPLIWPDGSLFGTFCILDVKVRRHSKAFQKLLWQFKQVIEDDFRIIHYSRDLAKRKGKLEHLVIQRTADLKWELDVNTALANLYQPLTAMDISVRDITRVILKQARNLTGSRHGFVAEIDPSTRDLMGHTLTDMMNECQLKDRDRTITFPRGEDGLYPGLWGHALNTREHFYTNSPTDHSASRGTPKGHVALTNYLSIPVMLAGELVGQIALANKRGGYSEKDIAAIKRLGEFYALALERKRTSEKEIQQRSKLQRSRKALLSILEEAKRHEEALKESEARYMDLYNNAPDMYVSVNAKSALIEKCNHTLADNLGYIKEEIIGRPIFDMYHPDCMDDVKKAFKSFIETGKVVDAELQLMRKDGSKLEVSLNVSAVRDDNGNIMYSRSTWRDRTERKRAEEELARYRDHLEELVRERTAELEASNKELEAFAYSVSHDLRAPLRHIDSFLDLLQKKAGTALDGQSRHYMETISEAAQKMGLLIDDLLAFSRMGRHALSFQPVDLGPLVRDVIRDLAPDAAGRTIEWRIGDLPVVEGDSAMLRMVLDNLIANALKFTRPRQQARIEIGSQPGQNAEAVIFVRDNGVGFDMAYADKLFGVFQRLHRTEEFEGTGIGLANVHRIIARHGGRTWAEGKPDQGAAFYFSLPHTIQRGKNGAS